MPPTPDQAELFERSLLAVYREAFVDSGLTYESLAEAAHISRAKLVRLVGPNPSGAADLDPRDSYRLAAVLHVDIVDAVRRAEQRVRDESRRTEVASD